MLTRLQLSPGLFPDQRDLQISWAVLFGIKAAAVDIARAPEQQVVGDVHQIVFLERLPFDQPKWREGLPEDAQSTFCAPAAIG